MDVSKLTVLGNVWDQFNVEKYAALAPDLLVSRFRRAPAPSGTSPRRPRTRSSSSPRAPRISVYDRQMTQPLERCSELAESLGADTEGRQGRRGQEALRGRRRAAAQGRQGPARRSRSRRLRQPGHLLRLRLEPLRRPGVLQGARRELRGAPGEAKKDSGGWFESLSWENVDKYHGRHHHDGQPHRRPSSPGLTSPRPTWKKLPAVKAGQVIPRFTEPIYSYDKCAPLLEDLAEAIEKAKKVG